MLDKVVCCDAMLLSSFVVPIFTVLIIFERLHFDIGPTQFQVEHTSIEFHFHSDRELSIRNFFSFFCFGLKSSDYQTMVSNYRAFAAKAGELKKIELLLGVLPQTERSHIFINTFSAYELNIRLSNKL